jgi:hypothetical protein
LEVAEKNVPEGAEPLHWLLWTTEPAQTLEQALAVLAIYKLRWRIEDFHLVLKQGCRIEQLQFETAERLAKAVALYAPIAARILTLRDLTRLNPEAPCTEVLSDTQWGTLWVAINHCPVPPGTAPPSVRQATLWIGRLGGHLNRKSDGMPGVKTLWLGWRDLTLMMEVYQAFVH